MTTETLFELAILIMSVVIHEVSHGYAALFQGDHTAEYQGRLTLNPIKHLDLLGSIIVPILCLLTPGGFVIGWAKPVPFNPYNLRNRRWGEALVALAGPLSNISIALIFGLLIRLASASLTPAFIHVSIIIVTINLLLAVFNLMPVPPLDGSKILFSLFPSQGGPVRAFLEQHQLILSLIFIFFGWQFIAPVVGILFTLIVGH